ncbi:MAG TPA: Rne/Rng family ribonuclease [Gaiellaceae bacterium]|nr:Rne/Rng family ribonuclease [Gaiellaceae bacterium]
MPWFRIRKKQSSDDQTSDVSELEAKPEPELAPAAEAAGTESTDPTKPKRRRGSRGGRGRKKSGSGSAAAAAAPERKEKGEAKQPQRRELSQRQERRRDQSSRRRREPQRRAPLPAAKRELLVSVDVGERRVAILEDERVAEVYLERPERRSIAGNIYLGRVDNVLPGMEAAFVEIGLEKNGFLYVDEIVRPELEKGHGRKIQDLVSRGQSILVQAVKDPMKTKGARLTTQISLPGRFVVLVPQGEGLGVSRRLDDDERTRLKDILKRLDVKEGGVIVRTAAEGASEEDIERDLVFLQRLWRSIQAKAKTAKAPELIYQEAELPLRVVRDLFTGDFEKAYVDDERTHRRIVGYLKKTSPHMVERVVRYRDKTPLMESFGVEEEIKSTIGRRVDLPSGGYLIFDYAEAFTVIDVNTGRFVGGRGKNSGGRLEDTITKNNLEAVKEVVRQLRLRDIGGIIVIDFIDMANPKNRATVEEALRTELERDRTKTYVVEISPLGLVEMTRQNVTDGPREVMTRKCPTCGGDGIVYSEASAAIDVERRLRALAAGSRAQAFRVELAEPIASALVGPGARRLVELEALTKKRFFLEGKPETHLDHFVVVSEGKLADLAPAAPVGEDAESMLSLVEVDRYDASAAVGKLEGLDVVVADAASMVGKRVKVRVERVLDGRAYAVLVRKTKEAPEPLTAEGEAEKPTRKPPARKGAGAAKEAEAVEVEETVVAEPEAEAEPEADETAETDEAQKPKKKTRRGSRGGRKRKKPVTAQTAETAEAAEAETETESLSEEAPEPARGVTIHVPGEELGRDGTAEPADSKTSERGATDEPTAAEAAQEASEVLAEPGRASAASPPALAAKKKTRRGSRGGKNRKKKPATAAANGSEEPAQTAEAPEAEPASTNGDFEYVPMSEWADELDRNR